MLLYITEKCGFESHWVHPTGESSPTVDIPTDWDPRASQSHTMALTASLCAAALFESHWVPHQIKNPPMQSISGFFGGVPSGTRTHGLQIHNLAR